MKCNVWKKVEIKRCIYKYCLFCFHSKSDMRCIDESLCLVLATAGSALMNFCLFWQKLHSTLRCPMTTLSRQMHPHHPWHHFPQLPAECWCPPRTQWPSAVVHVKPLIMQKRPWKSPAISPNWAEKSSRGGSDTLCSKTELCLTGNLKWVVFCTGAKLQNFLSLV